MEHLFKDDLLFVPKYSNHFICYTCRSKTVFKSKILTLVSNIDNSLKVINIVCTKCNHYSYAFIQDNISVLTSNFYLRDYISILLIKETPKHLD